MVIDVKRKMAGILVPVFALRHKNDFGIGDTISFKEAIDFCHNHRIGVLQTLPINETGGDNSPYNAISSVALDPTLIAMVPDKVPGLRQEHLEKLAPERLLSRLRQGPVDYPHVKELKQGLLKAAFASFEENELKKKSEAISLKQFEDEHRLWLPAYTMFRTLIEKQDGDTNWTKWDPAVQTFKAAESWLYNLPDCDRLLRTRRFWAYVQWVAFNQWDEVRQTADKASVKLMGDIPFGVSRLSADVWAHRELFDLDWSCGAPPELYFQGDLFTQKWGQNWGMPLYAWEEHKRQDFSWWRQRVKQVTRFFHYFRIDHVLGFFRVYAFPWFPEQNQEFVELTPQEVRATAGRLPQFLPRADEPPQSGELNCAHGEAVLRVLMQAAGESNIIAEDLGVVPAYVRPLLKKLNMAGFSIPMFERNDIDRSYKPAQSLPELSLVTYGTHDHVPLATFYQNLVDWWHGPNGHEGWLEVKRLMLFLRLDENNPPASFTWDLHRELISRLLRTRCWLAVLMITDLFGTEQRFNEPGLSGDYNWSQRLDRPINEYELDPHFANKIEFFTRLIKETNREPFVLTPVTSSQPSA